MIIPCAKNDVGYSSGSHHFLLLIILSFFSITVFAQQKVTGKVMSGDTAIAGATVTVKGTTIATVTDDNGSFSINAPTNATLVISYIGYANQEVKATNQNIGTIQLQHTTSQLGEVVVVGYGTQRKATLTGSVATVSGKEISKSPSPNVTSSMAGKLAGLTVNQRSGEPGRDDPSILIRGTGTFGDASPLIIIDGVERSLLSRLNPEDIESVSVLKDASAAIYGARAANGVILITTKKGVKGRTSFNFAYNYALQSPTKTPDMLDAATFAGVYNEGDFYRQGRPANYTPFYSDSAIQKFRNGADPVLYPNTNWVKAVLKPHSGEQRASLQASGGSDNVRYLFSFESINQDGNYRNTPTKYRQYNVRVKVDADVTKSLTVGANVYAILGNKTYPSVATNVNFINILQANPTIVSVYPNGLIGPGRLGENPLLLDQRGYDKIEDNPIYSTFTATYKVPFVQGLRVDASYNYDLSNQFEKLWSTPYYFYEYNVNTSQYDKKQGTGTSIASLTDTYRKWTTSLYNVRITYDKSFNNHHITALLGNEQQKNTYKFASAYRKNFVSTSIPEINVGSSSPADKDNSGSASFGAYNNYFGRLNYDYLSKYLLEFVFRYDGSQIFPKGKRYGFFPGISGGWRISEEKFMKDLTFIDQLKLRASYGELGNDRVGPYQYLQSYSFGNNYVFGTSDAPAIYPNTMPNPNITWEVSKKTDVGLEASLWKGLLGMELTLWKENRSNILAQPNLSVSNVFGFSGLPSENIGEVDNHGYELVLSHRNKAGKLTYDITGNVSYAKSKIIFMDEAPQPEPYQNLTGHPVGSALYYKADGIFHTQAELDKYPHGAGAQVGDIRVLDLNGDGVIDSKDQFRFDYSSTPQVTFGLNTNFQYKRFDLNIFFQGQTKAYNYDNTTAVLGGTDFANAVTWRAADRWTVDNPGGSKPRADAWSPGATTFFLFDATFVRLKTLELGYSLPVNVGKTKVFDNVRFYVSGFNLLTWSKEIKWSDPEISGDFTTYPPLRIINFGANVKF
ncbi:TonB-dependent receptor [Ilyomonas limi]|uniref:TonB-dependent receptor n=2 Tax=Ilyomonas limi TaxID=2575867 RepID=A0A4U3KXG4_9BACT|nr:TonB-dependent receptor [Ilyomonas limi]